MSLFAAGGSVGFFLAPALATPALIALGVPATALFLPPAALICFVLLRKHRREAAPGRRGAADRPRPVGPVRGPDRDRGAALGGVLRAEHVPRAVLDPRTCTPPAALAGIALTCFLAGGVAGTLLGGRIADRIGAVRTVQLGTAVILPALVGLLLVPGALAPLPFALATGIALNIPFAVLVKLGQDYLPTRPGTAAGVTLGLGVSVGGLFAPLLALIADAHGPRGALVALLAVPPATVLTSLMLREPAARQREPAADPS